MFDNFAKSVYITVTNITSLTQLIGDINTWTFVLFAVARDKVFIIQLQKTSINKKLSHQLIKLYFHIILHKIQDKYIIQTWIM